MAEAGIFKLVFYYHSFRYQKQISRAFVESLIAEPHSFYVAPICMKGSVAKGPKFRPQSTKGAEKIEWGRENLGPNF
jgi:hypothetical protein